MVLTIMILVIWRDNLCARYGGDEFIIVFTETSIDEGKRIVDELCKALSTSIQIDNNINTIIIHGRLVWRSIQNMEIYWKC